MTKPQLVLFDVNETLVSLQPLADILQKGGAPHHLLPTWCAPPQPYTSYVVRIDMCLILATICCSCTSERFRSMCMCIYVIGASSSQGRESSYFP
jgi:hypothetical protein